MSSRLNKFWGDVDNKINTKISESVTGSKVLDVGTGFGSLSNFLHKKGYDVVGTDILDLSIEAAKDRYPHCLFLKVENEVQPFEDQTFDTVILRDVIHHVKDESDVNLFISEIDRVAKNRIIICDPNPQFILRFSRKLIGHVDPECTAKEARSIFEGKFIQTDLQYSILYTLPLSGGYVGMQIIPDYLGKLAIFIENGIESLLWSSILEKISWRYFLILDRDDG
jgi:ubiquinone/menaquinone biosynthesis C-methylase UbiE